MTWERPCWYMTPQELADLIVVALEQTHHFKKDEAVHPEDLIVAFVTHAEAIGIGAGAVGRKVWEHERNSTK